MPSVVVDKKIRAPPEDVHALLQDFDRYPEWIPFTKSVISVDRKDGVVGTVYREQGTGGKSTWTVTEYVPNKREVHEGDIGIATIRLVMTMEPDDGGTRYRHEAVYKMKVPVLGWVIDKIAFGRMFRKGMHETVENLARVVEKESKVVAS